MSGTCKIVYIDESITDYVQIMAGGELPTIMELSNSSDTSADAQTEAACFIRHFRSF